MGSALFLLSHGTLTAWGSEKPPQIQAPDLRTLPRSALLQGRNTECSDPLAFHSWQLACHPPQGEASFTRLFTCPALRPPVPSGLPGGEEEAKRVGRREGQEEHLLELQLRRWMANSCPSALRRPVPWPKATGM